MKRSKNVGEHQPLPKTARRDE